jgi:hypothetical protein
MSIETILVILLLWTVVGTLAAFAFGKAMRVIGNAPSNEELLPSAADNVRYLQRNTRKASAKRVSDVLSHYGIAKQAS